MADIGKIDSRLAVPETLGRDDLKMYDVREAPFTLYGVTYSDGAYRRMPKDVAAKVSEGVYTLAEYTAGGRVAFMTDADTIAITCKRSDLWRMPHMALLGSAGFDLYVRGEDGRLRYCKSFLPTNAKEGYASLVSLGEYVIRGEKTMREFVIHFPLYCPITELLVGLPKNARLEKWNGYKRTKSMVFYGSSITQGGCASAPGNDYTGRLSRRFDTDYINLGFSGSCKAEKPMMEYLAGLDMSVFVYDYDHNAPSVGYLEATHYAGYRIIRDAHPDLPIILCTMPGYDRGDSVPAARCKVIKETYDRALSEGDKNIYLVDGSVVYAHFIADGCTVDGTHPNDLGFYRMAEAVGEKLSVIFGE